MSISSYVEYETGNIDISSWSGVSRMRSSTEFAHVNYTYLKSINEPAFSSLASLSLAILFGDDAAILLGDIATISSSWKIASEASKSNLSVRFRSKSEAERPEIKCKCGQSSGQTNILLGDLKTCNLKLGKHSVVCCCKLNNTWDCDAQLFLQVSTHTGHYQLPIFWVPDFCKIGL